MIRFAGTVSIVIVAVAPPSSAATKNCPSARVLSLETSDDGPLGERRSPGIELGQARAGTQTRFIVIVGPLLGSMDSKNVDTSVRCAVDGITFTSTISRSEYYDGSSAKNIGWRPLLTISLESVRSSFSITSTWRMVLSNGKLPKSNQLPPPQEQPFPFTLTRTFDGLPPQP